MVFIRFEHLVENGVVAARIVEDEDRKSNDEQDGGHLADPQGVVVEHVLGEAVVSYFKRRNGAFECGVVGARDEQAEACNA